MVVVTIIKVGLVAGVALATKKMGIWESPEHSVELLENAREHLMPYAQDLKDRICCWKCEERCDEEFDPKPWRESWIDSWNDTVKKAFIILNEMPNYFHRFTEDVQQGVKDLVKEKDPKADKKPEPNTKQKNTSSSKKDK